MFSSIWPISSHKKGEKKNYIYIFILSEILNLKGHPNYITGSKVMAIMLNGFILPIGETWTMEGLQSTGLPSLVLKKIGRHIQMN